MDENTFWKIIEDAKKRTSGDMEARIQKIHRALKKCSNQDLAQFYSIVQEKIGRANRWDLWAAAFLDNDGCGDDAFEYWRAGLVLAGQKAYEAVLAEPDMLAKFTVDFAEELSYAPIIVWEERNPGVDFPEPELKVNSLELEGEPFDEEDGEWFKQNFPKLLKKTQRKFGLERRPKPPPPPKEFFFKVYLPTLDSSYVSEIQKVMDSVTLTWEGIYGIPFISVGNTERGECMWEIFSHNQTTLEELEGRVRALVLHEKTIVTNDKTKILGTGLIRPYHMRCPHVNPPFEGQISDEWPKR